MPDRVGTTFLNLGMYPRGTKPGAGSRTADNPGLNGDKQKIDRAVGTEHNPDGSHKDGIIHAAQINADIADNVTIEKDVASGFLKVMADAIGGPQLNSTAVDGDSLEFTADNIHIKALGVKPGHLNSDIVIDTMLDLTAEGRLYVIDRGIAPLQIKHDNNRTKHQIIFSYTAGAAYAKVGNVQCTSTMGMPMSRAGSITKAIYRDSSPETVNYGNIAYGVKTFNAGDFITVFLLDGLEVRINNSASFLFPKIGATAYDAIIILEVEFDD